MDDAYDTRPRPPLLSQELMALDNLPATAVIPPAVQSMLYPRRQGPNAAAIESHLRALTAVVADHGVPPEATIAQTVARLLAGPRLKDARG